MFLVDSHCHLDRLDLSAFEGNLTTLLEHSFAHELRYILTIAVTLENAETAIRIAESDSRIFASVGVHPSEEPGSVTDVEKLRRLAKHPKVVALGETGLDYYYKDNEPALQKDRFEKHIALASELDLPLVVHTRDADEDTLTLLQAGKASQGVMHCFTRDLSFAKASLDLGFYISFSGILTFKNAESLRDVARYVPHDRFLIETDAPYLTPYLIEGKRIFLTTFAT